MNFQIKPTKNPVAIRLLFLKQFRNTRNESDDKLSYIFFETKKIQNSETFGCKPYFNTVFMIIHHLLRAVNNTDRNKKTK